MKQIEDNGYAAVLTLLVHLGYLTYDKSTGEAFIPNLEITQEFMNAVDDPKRISVSAGIAAGTEMEQACRRSNTADQRQKLYQSSGKL